MLKSTLILLPHLLLLLGSQLLSPANAQGLACTGWTKNFERACPPCPTGRQTRAKSQCSQSTNPNGSNCGSEKCEPCTCEGNEPAPGPIGPPTPAPTPAPPAVDRWEELYIRDSYSGTWTVPNAARGIIEIASGDETRFVNLKCSTLSAAHSPGLHSNKWVKLNISASSGISIRYHSGEQPLDNETLVESPQLFATVGRDGGKIYIEKVDSRARSKYLRCQIDVRPPGRGR